MSSLEQALRDVAELIARARDEDDVLVALVSEASRQIYDLPLTLTQFISPQELLVLASHGGPASAGTRIAFAADTLPDHVQRTASPYRVDDYRTQIDAEMAANFHIVAGVSVPIIVGGGVWGMFTVTSGTGPLPLEAESRLAGFSQLVTASFDSIEARGRLRAMQAHDEMMRSVQQDAAGAPISEVADQLVAYAASLNGVGRATLTLRGGVVTWAANPVLSVTPVAPRPSTSVRFAVMAQHWRLGVLTVDTTLASLPELTALQLIDLAEVTGRIILAITNRQHLNNLLDEQESLRRIAELAAQGVSLSQLFQAVVENAGRIFGATRTTLDSYQPGAPPNAVAIAVQPPVEGSASDPAQVTRLAQRAVETFRIKLSILVEGRSWGMLTLVWSAPPPEDTVDRLKPFADLTAMAIATTNNRDNLTRSRARIIAAGDEARRRLQRDVHDGAQQRLVHTILSLKLARDTARAGAPVEDLIEEAIRNAEDANRQLRDVVRGILPAALTRAGLVAGIESLVADVDVPVQLHLAIPRLPPAVETTAYFTVAEAITNAVKHACASRVTVTASISDKGELVVVVADDGLGGADPSRGSGLTGLRDRVEAGGGTLAIHSPEGEGTTLTARLRPHSEFA
ncbi:sensor histidine kinase [Microbacterium sp. P04]|uniref:sensor histidine kinase n=1 Tax=Microbacterium sp. P04 TaxID=3366947 RepID=UPI00374693F9